MKCDAYHWAIVVHNNTASRPTVIQCSVAQPGEHKHRIVIDVKR